VARDSVDFKYLFSVLVDMDLNWLVRGVAATAPSPGGENESNKCPELEREVVDLRAQVSVLKDVITQISQGKGQASSAPVGSIEATAQ
jgi:hypothetical protein